MEEAVPGQARSYANPHRIPYLIGRPGLAPGLPSFGFQGTI